MLLEVGLREEGLWNAFHSELGLAIGRRPVRRLQRFGPIVVRLVDVLQVHVGPAAESGSTLWESGLGRRRGNRRNGFACLRSGLIS